MQQHVRTFDALRVHLDEQLDEGFVIAPPGYRMDAHWHFGQPSQLSRKLPSMSAYDEVVGRNQKRLLHAVLTNRSDQILEIVNGDRPIGGVASDSAATGFV